MPTSVLGGFFGDALRRIGREVTHEVVDEVQDEMRAALRDRVDDTLHRTFFVYRGSDPAAALKHFKEVLQSIEGVETVKVGKDPTNSRRRALLVDAIDARAAAEAKAYLGDHAPNVNKRITLL